MHPIDWTAIGAIATVLNLLLVIWRERRHIEELYNSVRAGSISLIGALKKAIILATKRLVRPLLVTASLMLLGIWISGNILVQPALPLSGWSISHYAFAVAQVIPLGALIYVLVVEPWQGIRQAKETYDLFLMAVNKMPVLPVVFYDDSFPCSWVASPALAADYFVKHGFALMRADELEGAMQSTIKHGTAQRTVFVFIHDVVPASITQVRHPSCTLRKYLDAGGRVVWWGDIPLHVRGFTDQLKEEWRGGQIVLSVDHYSPPLVDTRTNMPLHSALWERHDLDSRIQLTEAGRAIGLKNVGQCKRPAGVDQSTIVYSEIAGDLGLGEQFTGLRWALSWRKVFNPAYPHSGFMQYPLGEVDCSEISVVQDFFRFAASDCPFAFSGS